jgi:hypothetical protein
MAWWRQKVLGPQEVILYPQAEWSAVCACDGAGGEGKATRSRLLLLAITSLLLHQSRLLWLKLLRILLVLARELARSVLLFLPAQLKCLLLVNHVALLIVIILV